MKMPLFFFSKDILPIIREKINNITFTVVGRNPSPLLRKLVKDYPQIELTGWVEDTRLYIARSALFIVPLRIGGGTRMKIYEAMAMGKTVVSTSVGAEGLPVKNEENIIIEDNQVKFAEKIVHLLKNRPEREKIELAACAFVKENSHGNMLLRNLVIYLMRL